MYLEGGKICLARIKIALGSNEIVVTDTFLVTIVGIKTGVLGKFSNKPSSLQSLLAMDSNGVFFEKNWNYWPERTSFGPEIAWFSLKAEQKEEGSQLVEICRFYNRDVSCRMGHPDALILIDEFGVEFRLDDGVETGDARYCSNHDRWLCPGEDECIGCEAESQKEKIPDDDLVTVMGI